MRAAMWFLIDTGWFLVTAAATVLTVVALIATPIWLGLIHRELVALRGEVIPCRCECDDGPGPVLPRVLPRLRNLREEGGE
jgi:hypothetical protein